MNIAKYISHNVALFSLAVAVLGVVGFSGFAVWKNSNNSKAKAYNYPTILWSYKGNEIRACQLNGVINLKLDTTKSATATNNLATGFASTAKGTPTSVINSTVGKGIYYKYRTIQNNYFYSISSPTNAGGIGAPGMGIKPVSSILGCN